MRLEVDLLDLRGNLDLAERLAARVGVLLGCTNGTGLFSRFRRPTHFRIEHIGHGACHVDVDLVTDFQVGQRFGLFGQLERHILLLVRAFHRDLSGGQVDSRYLCGDMAFQRLAPDGDTGSLYREAGSRGQRGKGYSTSESTNGVHRRASL
ncbi:hypothetical protein D9M73_188600 [compost metagenome]